MQITIQGHGMNVGQKLEGYVREKADRIDRYFPGADELRVEFKRDSARDEAIKTVQMTARRKRTIIRVEEHGQDAFATVDLAMDKLYHRIARFKDRHVSRKRSGHAVDEEMLLAEAPPIALAEADDDDGIVVRAKTFSVVPMTVEEAIEQMELIGHDFFMFMHETDNTVKVVYRRKQGNYGLLQPER
jgi:putative sigma-54 modulation protein